jgi:hypothetical protein
MDNQKKFKLFLIVNMKNENGKFIPDCISKNLFYSEKYFEREIIGEYNVNLLSFNDNKYDIICKTHNKHEYSVLVNNNVKNCICSAYKYGDKMCHFDVQKEINYYSFVQRDNIYSVIRSSTGIIGISDEWFRTKIKFEVDNYLNFYNQDYGIYIVYNKNPIIDLQDKLKAAFNKFNEHKNIKILFYNNKYFLKIFDYNSLNRSYYWDSIIYDIVYDDYHDNLKKIKRKKKFTFENVQNMYWLINDIMLNNYDEIYRYISE